MLLYKTFSGSQESLLDHVRELNIFSRVNISRQSIDERFTPAAVDFVQKLFADQISNHVCPANDGVLKAFNGIFIQDSTRFKLPRHLKDSFKGYGVKGMEAGATLQFCYELGSHSFKEVELTAATVNDSLKAVDRNWIQENSLVLRDLGYYKIESLKEIANKGAYYISKAKPRSHFFDSNGDKLDIKALRKDMETKGLDHVSLHLSIGSQERLPTKVIFRRVPKEVYEQRIREKAAKGKSRGWQMGQDYKAWCSMDIFITNVPETLLTDQKVMDTYRLRWQIELVFKTWKSHYCIHQFKKYKQPRAEVYVYSTLLLIVMHWKIFSWLQQQWKLYNTYISLHKFSKYMVQISSEFASAIMLKKSSICRFIESFLIVEGRFLAKETKCKKLGFSDILKE